MSEFNYTGWMQQNKVGPFTKASLKESHEANDQWYEDFQDGLRNLFKNGYVDKYSYNYYVGALDHVDPMDNYSHLSGHDAAKEFVDDLRTQSAILKDKEKFRREKGLEEDEDDNARDARADKMEDDDTEAENAERDLDEGSESVTITIPENTDYKQLAKAVAKVLIEDYGQHNYKPFLQALIAELK